jgi:hypothetical protein
MVQGDAGRVTWRQRPSLAELLSGELKRQTQARFCRQERTAVVEWIYLRGVGELVNETFDDEACMRVSYLRATVQNRARLADLRGLSHLTIEVQPCPGH